VQEKKQKKQHDN
jgi:hypothetical protein